MKLRVWLKTDVRLNQKYKFLLQTILYICIWLPVIEINVLAIIFYVSIVKIKFMTPENLQYQSQQSIRWL